MSKRITRRRLLASVGGVAGLALGGTAGAVPAGSASTDEPPVRWNRTYAPNRLNGAVSALERDDQYVVLGTTGDESTQQTGWLFGVDATTGAGQWQTTVENTDLDRQPSFQKLAEAPDDDGLVLLGARLTDGVASLVKAGPEGGIQWWEDYGVETDGDAEGTFLSSSLVPVEDGYFLCGYQLAGGSISGLVVEVSLDGTERGRTRLFTEEQSILVDAIPDGNGGVVAVGGIQEQTTAAGGSRTRAVAVRLDSDLSVAWEREYTAPSDGDPLQTNLLRAVTGTGEGYAAVGSAAPEGGSSSSGWLLRFGADGTEGTSRLYDPQPVTALTSVVDASDGLTVVGQLAESGTSTATTGWVAELDDDGAGRWSKTFSPAATNNAVDAIATSDEGVAVVGTVQAESQSADPRSQGWLVKLGGDPAPSVTSTASGATDTPESTPTDTPVPTATPMATTTPAEMATETPDDGTTSGSGPGFGAVGTVAALGVAAMYRRLGGETDE